MFYYLWEEGGNSGSGESISDLNKGGGLENGNWEVVPCIGGSMEDRCVSRGKGDKIFFLRSNVWAGLNG